MEPNKWVCWWRVPHSLTMAIGRWQWGTMDQRPLQTASLHRSSLQITTVRFITHHKHKNLRIEYSTFLDRHSLKFWDEIFPAVWGCCLLWPHNQHCPSNWSWGKKLTALHVKIPQAADIKSSQNILNPGKWKPGDTFWPGWIWAWPDSRANCWIFHAWLCAHVSQSRWSTIGVEKQVMNFANGANVKEVDDDGGNYQGRSGPLYAIRA